MDNSSNVSVFPKNTGNISQKQAREIVDKTLSDVFPQIAEATESLGTLERLSAEHDLRECAIRLIAGTDADRLSPEDIERLARQAVQSGLNRVCPGKLIRFPDMEGDWNPGPWEWQDPATIAPLECLLGGHYWRGEVGITVAPGGVGKSILSIIEALAAITGKPLLGEATRGGLRVMIMNYEDSELVLRHRVTAAHLHHKIRQEETKGRLFIESLRGDVMRFAKASSTGVDILEPNAIRLADVIRRWKIDIVILDPWVSIHGIDGNLGHLVQPIVSMFKGVAEETDSAIGIVAHSRKTNGHELTEEDMAGAFTAVNKARDVRVLNRMDAATAKKFGLASWEADDYFRVDNPKHTHTRSSAPVWRRKVSVSLGNGGSGALARHSEVGVVALWNPPTGQDIVDGLEPGQISAIKASVTAGLDRADARAKSWAGVAVADVLGLNLAEEAQKAKAGSVIKALIKVGHFLAVDRKDPKWPDRKIPHLVRSEPGAASARDAAKDSETNGEGADI